MPLQFYSIRNAKIRYDQELILFKMLKKGTGKVRLGSYFAQNAKNKVGLEFCSNKNGKKRYDQGFYSIKNVKIRCGWHFLLLKMLKKAELVSYIAENAKTK